MIPEGPLLAFPFNELCKSFLINKSFSAWVIYANSVEGWSGDDLAFFGAVTISDGE